MKENDLNTKKERNNMPLDAKAKVVRTLWRLLNIKTIPLFLMISLSTFLIIWNFFEKIENKLLVSIIIAILLTYIVKYFEYYDE